MARGILTADVFAKDDAGGDRQDKSKVASLSRLLQDAPFVRMADGIPKHSSVTGSNFCHIGFEPDKQSASLTVISATDNLGKAH